MAAKLVLDKVKDKSLITLMFHDVPCGHDEDMYRFNDDISNYLGIPITEASTGETLWQCIERNHCLPSVHIPFCNRELKQVPAEKYYASLRGEFALHNGYGAEEKRRIEKQKLHAKYPIRYPCYEAGLTSTMIKKIISQDWGIKLPRAYDYFEHNN